MSVKIKELGVIPDGAIANMEVHIKNPNHYTITLPILPKDICPAMKRRVKDMIKDIQHNTRKKIDPFVFMDVINYPDDAVSGKMTIAVMLNIQFVDKNNEIDSMSFVPNVPSAEAQVLVDEIIPKANKLKSAQIGS